MNFIKKFLSHHNKGQSHEDQAIDTATTKTSTDGKVDRHQISAPIAAEDVVHQESVPIVAAPAVNTVDEYVEKRQTHAPPSRPSMERRDSIAAQILIRDDEALTPGLFRVS
ncbi:hypothetical protein CBS101457_004892 [Exobasidium rhododendri]|nr:hypothetical protein CBS101457_004892 [Exobasidium rhododendri]